MPLTYFASAMNLGTIRPVPTIPTFMILNLLFLIIVEEMSGVRSR